MATVQETFDYMRKVFNKKEADKIKTKNVLNFSVLGTGGGMWQMVIEKGAFSVQEGTPVSPVNATVIYKDVDSFYNLVTGEISGVKGYAKGLIKYNGSPRVLVTIGKLFPGKKNEE